MKRRHRLIITLLMVATVLAGPLALGANAAGPGAGRATRWDKISPELRSIMASNPGGSADVILLMNAPAQSSDARERPERAAERKIEKHGGAKPKALGIVAGASGRIGLDRLAALSQDPDVRYIAYDAALIPTGDPYGGDVVDFARALNADKAWEKGVDGSGVAVAVIDSGVSSKAVGNDRARLRAAVDLVDNRKATGRWLAAEDPGGHGTHVAGIIAGERPEWSGVAPGADIVSVRVIDDTGRAQMSTVIRGIQWVLQNRDTYGIRIINLSLGAPATSHFQDPLAAAVEIAWHAGLVVITSAGNTGPASGSISTPGYDPFVVTVGAVDMSATLDRKDDVVTPWSSRGPAVGGLAKPDVVAPGRKILSSLAPDSYLSLLFPERVTDGSYFRLSGTSQAAAAVSGVAALVLSSDPSLKPDQVKWRLMCSATRLSGFDANAQGAGYVDAAAAIRPDANRVNGRVSETSRPADAFAAAVHPLIAGNFPLTWKSLDFNGGNDSRGVPWANVMWDNVMWDNVTWDNVMWDNVVWDNVMWDNIMWDNVMWDNIMWDNVMWDNVMWDTVGGLD